MTYPQFTKPVMADFYSIFKEDGVKQIKLWGYTYEGDPGDWRIIDCTHATIPLSEFVDGYKKRGVEFSDEVYEDARQYEDEVSAEVALSTMNDYFSGQNCSLLSWEDVTEETAEGFYCNIDKRG